MKKFLFVVVSMSFLTGAIDVTDATNVNANSASNTSASVGVGADGEKTSSSEAIKSCLAAWGNSPFNESSGYKTLAASVKVFGLGQGPRDDVATDKPELVLVQPAVNIMGGTTYELMNPNGWYCFKSNVNVMGNLHIKTNCKSHLASAKSGATVMGQGDSDKGVTVMGATRVEMASCN